MGLFVKGPMNVIVSLALLLCRAVAVYVPPNYTPLTATLY